MELFRKQLTESPQIKVFIAGNSADSGLPSSMLVVPVDQKSQAASKHGKKRHRERERKNG